LRKRAFLTVLLAGVVGVVFLPAVAAAADTWPWAAASPEGGFIAGWYVVLAQLLLAVLGLGIAVERLASLRRSRVVPESLLDTLMASGAAGEWGAVHEAASRHDGAVAAVARFVADHRDNAPAHVMTMVASAEARHLRRQLQRAQPLAIAAGLAPLLGLAAAGAAVVVMPTTAGSIADVTAAMTPAVTGLLVAMPLGLVYLLVRQRTLGAQLALEAAVERLVDAWVLRPDADRRRRRQRSQRVGRRAAGRSPEATTPQAALPRADAPEVTPPAVVPEPVVATRSSPLPRLSEPVEVVVPSAACEPAPVPERPRVGSMIGRPLPNRPKRSGAAAPLPGGDAPSPISLTDEGA
jgi:biopolymer transport protein ExbB